MRKRMLLINNFIITHLEWSLRLSRYIQHNDLYGSLVLAAAVLSLQHICAAVLARRDDHRQLGPVVFHVHREVVSC